LSAADEARIWKQAVENFADNLEYRKIALNNFQEAASRVQAEIEKINQELIEKEKQITDEYQKTLQEREKTLHSFAGLFDQFAIKTERTGDELLGNLQSQID